MSLLRNMMDGALKIRADIGGSPAPWDDFWYQPIGSRSATGMRVSPESAKQVAAVLACVNKIAKTMGMMPLPLFTDLPDGGKKRLKSHWLYPILFSRPNHLQTSFEWRQMMQGHLELRGNAYSEILPANNTPIGELMPMHPDRVKPEQLRTGRIRYRYNDPLTNEERTLAQEQVFHLRNFMDNGIEGQSTVALMTDVIGTALAAQDNYARFLRNDSQGSVVFTGAHFKTKQDQTEFRNDWQAAHTGENRYKVGVLPTGMDVKSIGVSQRDAELLDARKFSRIEIASGFDIPPHLIGETEKTATYASVEQFNIMFVTFCILPRAVLWEQAIQRALLFGNTSIYPKFLMNALLRGDTAARYNAYKVAIENGWMSQDDVRLEEDLNPIPNGEGAYYWRPLAWARLGDVHASIKGKGTGDEDAGQADDSDEGTQSTTGEQSIDKRFRLLAIAGAERCINKESKAVARMIERDCTKEEIDEFYRDHAQFIAKVLRIPPEKAQAYCERRSANLSLPDVSTSITELTKLAVGGIQ